MGIREQEWKEDRKRTSLDLSRLTRRGRLCREAIGKMIAVLSETGSLIRKCRKDTRRGSAPISDEDGERTSHTPNWQPMNSSDRPSSTTVYILKRE